MVEICQQILDKEENMKIQFGFFWGSQTKSEIKAKKMPDTSRPMLGKCFPFFLSVTFCVWAVEN